MVGPRGAEGTAGGAAGARRHVAGFRALADLPRRSTCRHATELCGRGEAERELPSRATVDRLVAASCAKARQVICLAERQGPRGGCGPITRSEAFARIIGPAIRSTSPTYARTGTVTRRRSFRG